MAGTGSRSWLMGALFVAVLHLLVLQFEMSFSVHAHDVQLKQS